MKKDGKEMTKDNPTKEEKGFEGYTMSELQYQRALLLVKREFMREKALGEVNKIKSRIPVVNGKSAFSNLSASGVAGKLIKGLNFADYLLLGFQALKIGKKVTSIFRKRK